MIEEHHKRNEDDIEQEPASRMSRNSRKKAKKSKETNPSAAKVKSVMESVIAALFRYFSFVLDILKSPVRTALDYDRSYFKYSVISMTLLAVFFRSATFISCCGPGENSRVRVYRCRLWKCFWLCLSTAWLSCFGWRQRAGLYRILCSGIKLHFSISRQSTALYWFRLSSPPLCG